MTEGKRRIRKITLIFILLPVATFAVSSIIWLTKTRGVRYAFVFPSADGSGYTVEARLLPFSNKSENIERFVSELLLGPLTEHSMPLFKKGTACKACFVHRGTLYLNISDQLFAENLETTDLRGSFTILRKNITLNFPGIRTIELFIDGRKAFSNE